MDTVTQVQILNQVVYISHALLQSVCNMKVTLMNIVQRSLIQKMRFYKFELGRHATEATRNIFVRKGKSQLIII